MLATALPQVLPAPVVAPATSTAPTPATGSGQGPESFSHMLDAAEARCQAQHPASKSADARPSDAKPAPATAAKWMRDAATGEETDSAGPDLAQAGGKTVEVAVAVTTADAAADPPPATEPAPGTDAAALLAGLAALPRTPIADAARIAHTDGQADGAAAETAGTEATPRLVTDTLEPAGIAPRRMGGGAMAGGGSDSGHQAREPFAQLMQQARAETRATDPITGTGAQPLRAVDLRAVDLRAADTVPADTEGLASGTAGLARGATPSVMSDLIPNVMSDAMFMGVPSVMPKVMPGAAAAVVLARLAASPGSPEFAGQLSAQLTTFVSEGVQHARLELHPLELGPVTVQIAVDGAQARVNLAAEHAATRQALEQAMPALASSLREAGLTLSGGGVFEQPRQPQPDRGAATADGRDGSNGRRERDRGNGTTADSGPAPLAGAHLRRRGVVDLVA